MKFLLLGILSISFATSALAETAFTCKFENRQRRIAVLLRGTLVEPTDYFRVDAVDNLGDDQQVRTGSDVNVNPVAIEHDAVSSAVTYRVDAVYAPSREGIVYVFRLPSTPAPGKTLDATLDYVIHHDRSTTIDHARGAALLAPDLPPPETAQNAEDAILA